MSSSLRLFLIVSTWSAALRIAKFPISVSKRHHCRLFPQSYISPRISFSFWPLSVGQLVTDVQNQVSGYLPPTATVLPLHLRFLTFSWVTGGRYCKVKLSVTGSVDASTLRRLLFLDTFSWVTGGRYCAAKFSIKRLPDDAALRHHLFLFTYIRVTGARYCKIKFSVEGFPDASDFFSFGRLQ